MKGIIIAGGFGTRLRPLTYSRPKHLLPVANRPFLEYQVALLRAHGVADIVFATNYFADKIEAHFGDGSAFGVTMRYALENEPLGTAGAIRNAAELIELDTTLVLNGDILTDFDIGQIVAFHRERGAQATIALRPVERPHAFGVLDTESDGRVISWREPSEEEKRRVAAAGGAKTGEFDRINAGIYVFEPEVIAGIPVDRPVSLEREVFPKLLEAGAPVFGVVPEGYWTDMGHPEQYLLSNAAVLRRMVETEAPFEAGIDRALAGGAIVDDATSLGRNVSIGSGSRVAESIMMDGVQVGSNVQLDGVIAEEDVVIEDDVTARRGVVLARGTVVRRGSRL
jgi:NDP-sugar pyrophosphorylase family protein